MAFVFQDRLQFYLNSARLLFARDGREDLAAVISSGKPDLQVETGYDNWDGGQYSHTLTFFVPLEVFHNVANDLAKNEQDLAEMLNRVSNDAKNESLEAVSIQLDDSLDQTTPAIPRLSKGVKLHTAFDEYTLVTQVGSGGNGRVFSAKDKDGNDCAIKFLDKGRSSTKLKRFKNEIRFCEVCHHPNIVPILDYGYANVLGEGYAFYVMPLYAKSLKTRIEEKGLRPEEAVSIFVGLLRGLKEAHQHEAIHRDIKPDNIMFAKGSDEPVICDFGIAHIPAELHATSVVTQPEDRMGNRDYSAPEQRGKSGRAVPQSDIYSAGLILNEMFTGEIPTAAGYKTIAQVSPEYAYLDEVFELIFKQNPQDRLYPEDSILSEMRVRAEIQGNKKAVEQLRNTAENDQTDAIKCPKVVDKVYRNGILNFEFDIAVPREWLEILNEGSFHHSSVMGYDTNRVVRAGDRTLQLNVQGLDVEDIRRAVEWFYDWVTTVNAKYTDMLTVWYVNKRREEDLQRKREIARLEEENRIQSMLAKI